MFRALRVFSIGNTKAVMQPPTGIPTEPGQALKPVELVIRPEAIFSTAIGASSKKTLASWHVTTPEEVIQSMLELVNGPPNRL